MHTVNIKMHTEINIHNILSIELDGNGNIIT